MLALQMGHTKCMGSLYLWDSQDDEKHYQQTQWPTCNNHTVGNFNIKCKALVDHKKIYLTPLHIKLGLMKNFVKALDFTGDGFKNFNEKFGAVLTDAKLKVQFLVGPQVRDLIRDPVPKS